MTEIDYQDMMSEEYLTPKMVSEKLHIGMTKIYKLFKMPGFPAIRIGNQLLIENTKLRKYLDEYSGSVLKL